MKYNLAEHAVLPVIMMLAAVAGMAAGEIPGDEEHWVYQPEDRVIFGEILSRLSKYEALPVADLMVRTGHFFLETPYVAHTLETEKEQMVINLREMDCTTFAENCLAISRTLKSDAPTFEQFVRELKYIRYRDGRLEGYPSRLHYFCDWIYNNQEKGTVRDLSEAIGHRPLSGEINFMSTHPGNYVQLRHHPELIPRIELQEKNISARTMFYIPEALLGKTEHELHEGDIVAITTDIPGLAIMHVGIAVKKNNRIHLMHASSAAGQVVISEGTLEEYLLGRRSATGIMVARPL